MIKIEGIVMSVDGDVVRVCTDGKRDCSGCTYCPLKGAADGVVETALTPGIEPGQRVVLRDRRRWFVRNRIMAVVLAFCAGVVLVEALFGAMPFFPREYQHASGLLGGAALAVAVIAGIAVHEGAKSGRRDDARAHDFEIVGRLPQRM